MWTTQCPSVYGSLIILAMMNTLFIQLLSKAAFHVLLLYTYIPAMYNVTWLLDQVNHKPEEEDYTDDHEHYNRSKNRYSDCLPCELHLILS